jgi:hypothetical protein
MLTTERKLIPVTMDNKSTLYSCNGTCPESPDGTRLCYVSIDQLSQEKGRPVKAELWVCGINADNHKKLVDVSISPHNGADASWIDNNSIVYTQICDNGVEGFFVIDADTGLIKYGPIYGQLGHKAVNKLVPYDISTRHLKAYAGGQPPELGLYCFDTTTGTTKLLISLNEIYEHVKREGYIPLEGVKDVFHMQLSPLADKVMIRMDFADSKIILSRDLKTGRFYIIPNKPLHQLWYDNDTIFAVNALRGTGKVDRNIYRFDLSGNSLELLGGRGNHIDISPDGKLLVTDNMYHKSPHEIYIYRHGETTPAAVLYSSDITHPIWQLEVHANPVFSRDNRRIYFVHGTGESSTRAVYADISFLH